MVVVVVLKKVTSIFILIVYIYPTTLLVKSSALALPAHWYLCFIALVFCFVLVLWTTTVNSGISSFLEDALGVPEILQRY